MSPIAIRRSCRTSLSSALLVLVATLVFHDKLLTTSAVSAVVIGFALQDTLGNAFAGLAIQSERPFHVGHWIRVGDFEGRVAEVTWRATKLRTKAGNFVVVPNNIVSKEAITNYSEPAAAVRIEVEVGASYLASPGDGEGGDRRGARQLTARVEGAARRTSMLRAFDSSAINYRVRFWIEDYERDEAARDEVRTGIYYAFARHGIEIPWPIQVQYEREWKEAGRSRTRRRARPVAGRRGSVCRPRRGMLAELARATRVENVRQRRADRPSGRAWRVDVRHRIRRGDGGARAGSPRGRGDRSAAGISVKCRC